MAKKMKTSTSFKWKISNSFFYSIVIIFFLFCIFVVYAYTTPKINRHWFSMQGYFTQLYVNWQNSQQPPIPTVKPQEPVARSYPPLRLTPQSTEQLPSLTLNKLIIFQTRSSDTNIAIVTKVITDPAEIKKIYDDINSLPMFQPGTYNCPEEFANSFDYVLNFYSNNVLTIHAIVETTGCAEVDITNYQPRLSAGSNGEKLTEDLQQTLNLSGQAYFGH